MPVDVDVDKLLKPVDAEVDRLLMLVDRLLMPVEVEVDRLLTPVERLLMPVEADVDSDVSWPKFTASSAAVPAASPVILLPLIATLSMKVVGPVICTEVPSRCKRPSEYPAT